MRPPSRFHRRSVLGILLLGGLLGCTSDDVVLPPPPEVADPILIDARWNPSTPLSSQTADIEVTIQNQGGYSSPATSLRIDVVRNPCTASATVVISYSVPVPALQPGQAVVVGDDHFFNNQSGTYGLYLELDPDEVIDEDIPGSWDGESNNSYSCSAVVDKDGKTTLSAGETVIVVVDAFAG